MKKPLMRFKILLIASLSCCASFAQDAGGPRAQALGGTSLTHVDQWCALNNQAGLAFAENFSGGIFYESRFLVDALSDKGLGAVLPVGAGAFGLSLRSFGYSLYSETKAGLSYGMKFSEKFAGGVQANYFNVRLGEGYGTRSAVSVDGGFLYRMNKNLSLAAHVTNPNRAKLADYNDERLPSLLRAGAAYHFSEKVFLATEVWKASDATTQVRAGIEYRVIEPLHLRIGAGSKPGLMSFGFGYVLKNFRIDFSSSYHSVLGFSPQVGLSFVPVEK
ncbi:MAG: hypothetical protein SH856_10840 [Flavobacteriales bacterium]|nr:hypothetical protein [Flavobacteriales bacterium]